MRDAIAPNVVMGNAFGGAFQEDAALLNRSHDAAVVRLQSAMNEADPAAAFAATFSTKDEIRLPQYVSWEHNKKGFPAYVRRMDFSVAHSG